MPCVDAGPGSWHEQKLEKEVTELRQSSMLRNTMIGSKNLEIQEQLKINSILSEEISKLNACLCAIMRELSNRNIMDEVILVAAKDSMFVEIKELWEKHQKEDENRIKQALNEFSNHDKAIMKKILSQGDSNE